MSAQLSQIHEGGELSRDGACEFIPVDVPKRKQWREQ